MASMNKENGLFRPSEEQNLNYYHFCLNLVPAIPGNQCHQKSIQSSRTKKMSSPNANQKDSAALPTRYADVNISWREGLRHKGYIQGSPSLMWRACSPNAACLVDAFAQNRVVLPRTSRDLSIRHIKGYMSHYFEVTGRRFNGPHSALCLNLPCHMRRNSRRIKEIL